jgi:hypothetical protein
LGAEQYAKAATALFILRETVMGNELFDKSFKEYAQPLGIQTSEARRFLPHDGGCLGR